MCNTNNEARELWEKVIDIIDGEGRMSPEINNWFRPLEPLSIDENNIYLKARDDFHKKMCDTYHLEQRFIEGIIKSIAKKEYKIHIII